MFFITLMAPLPQLSSISHAVYPKARCCPQPGFNILMSNLPLDPSLSIVTYGDDIAVFATAPDVQCLYGILQVYLT